MTANSLAEAYLEKCALRLEIPTQAYGRSDAETAIRFAERVLGAARRIIEKSPGSSTS